MRLLLAALALSAAAASWYLATHREADEPRAAITARSFDAGGPPVEERRPKSRVRRFYGLQTTVPDTVGYNEKTAIFALEEGGFRVRVMQRKVSAVAEEGRVVQQLPRGGVTRRVGWIVTIVVGVGR